jgi:uncharacterized membrane protein YoaK (UPF0700 family)
VATTYITGTLTTLVTRLARGRRRPEGDPSRPAESPGLLLAIWLAYLGAAATAAATTLVGLWLALAVPLGLLALVIGVALVRFRRAPSN